MYEVEKLLMELGMPQNILGFRYLKTALEMDLAGAIVSRDFMHNCYGAVAKAHGTTPSRAERAMRHATEVVFDRGDVDTIKSVFGNSVNPNKGKATVSEFIKSCTSYIRRGDKKMSAGDIRIMYLDKLLSETYPEYAQLIKEAENND